MPVRQYVKSAYFAHVYQVKEACEADLFGSQGKSQEVMMKNRADKEFNSRNVTYQ